MPLRGLKRSKEIGLPARIDVRSFNIPAEKEVTPYPIPGNIERAITPDDVTAWLHEYNFRAKEEEWFNTLKILFQLKILVPDIFKPGHIVDQLGISRHRGEMRRYLTAFNPRPLDNLGQYCYVFSKKLEEVLDKDNELRPESILDSIEADFAKGYHSALEDLMFATQLYPDFFTPAVLKKYWPGFFKKYQAQGFESQLQAAAYLRVLYPEHLADLKITKEGIDQLVILGVDPKYDLAQYAYLKILARPEIPGLTTWPPEKIEQSRLADSVPEQPEQLAI